MAGRLLFRRRAEIDLTAIFDFLQEVAGSARAALFLDEIEQTCWNLVTYPHLGRSREDMAPGIRTISMRRRVVIAYRVLGEDIEIVTVAYAGRDWEALFRDPED
jgi:toxin ParE1/3/4